MKQWSTKDLTVIRPPENGKPGEGIMRFSDRYSVFDYGVLGDLIPGKGVASCAMAVRSFALFDKAGVHTHFLEQVADDAIRIRLLDIDTDGSKGPTGPGRTVPLQVIYRLALPRESSVHRRARQGELDASTVPPYGQAPWLAAPMVEFTTKYEETDRFVSRAEAARVGAVDVDALTELASIAKDVARVLDAHCRDVGLTLVDGKAEFGYDGDRQPMLIDHAGTPDENRFYFRGVPVCKELLRYLHPGLRAVVRSLITDGVPRVDWPAQPNLAPDLVAATSAVYTELAAVWQGGPTAGLRAAIDDFTMACGSDLGDRTGLRTEEPVT